DVVVQTIGQLRDIAASRLFLINRAVNMAAGAKDDEYENFVAQSIVEAERVLVDKGIAPKTAREIAHHRVFGGVNGGYGTGIQSMVQAGDRWESEQEIADVYLNNMGAFYGDETQWESVQQYAFEAALTGTDAVIQPRQSNTWGALSLDHVYEFMGGLNLAVRNVTGKEPDAYLSDYRNHNHMHIQELKEAIGVESRTTLLNPNYIDEMMKGGASSAGTFAELVQNTYGWNVMKPKAIDNEMWDEIYEVYVKDKYNLQVHNFFETQNPAALQEMTAVMMETARKGMWQATEQQLADIAELHTRLVNQYDAACSGTVCDNAKLRQYIASKVDPQTAAQYQKQIQKARQPQTSDNNSQSNVVMKKEELSQAEKTKHIISNVAVAVIVVAVLSIIVAMVIRRRKTDNE
ncbi:MAG: cobaltochelatase subunit CobN, partial [Bacteroidales bacterium]|nr:cobaltochelatase subunit CobN [Bacteroidales bacterium]